MTNCKCKPLPICEDHSDHPFVLSEHPYFQRQPYKTLEETVGAYVSIISVYTSRYRIHYGELTEKCDKNNVCRYYGMCKLKFVEAVSPGKILVKDRKGNEYIVDTILVEMVDLW